MPSPRTGATKTRQVADAFGYQWAQREGFDSAAVLEWERKWMVESYLDGDPLNLWRLFPRPDMTILDCGCGAGISAIALFRDVLNKQSYYGIDISTAVHEALRKFREFKLSGQFTQADLMEELPAPWPSEYDLVFMEGVLPFVEDPEAAVLLLASRVKPGGHFLFYAYAKMPPVRAFTDELIHSKIAHLGDKEAWEKLTALSKLGMAIGKLKAEVTVGEDIALLGIKAGKYDLQRLLYYHFVKMFYNEEFSLEETVLQNHDNFRPAQPARHDRKEIEAWFPEAGLELVRCHETLAGYSFVTRRLP